MRAGLLRLLPGLAALVLAAGIARAAPDDPYYYGLNDERQGPVTETVLLQKLRDGALPSDTLVWTKGMADWQEAATVFDLRAPQAQTTDNRATGNRAAGDGAAGDGAGDAKALRLKLTEIMDPSGFEQPTRAASTVIPADWTAQGGVIWKVNNECAGGQQFQWQALSPDGRAAISMLPNSAWATSSLGGGIRRDCLRMRMDSAEDFVRHLVSQLDQGRVVDIFRDPATMKTVSAFNYETPGDPYIKHWRDAVAATFSFRQNGEDYRAVATFMTLHFHMVSGHSFGIGAPAEMTNGSSVMLTTFEAPAAEFDALLPAFMMFHANFRIDPAWQARISKMNRNMAQDNLETSRNIARINADTSASILDSGMESWRRRQQSEGRLSRETSEMIRGEETYAAQTPSGQISLPGGYANAYQLNDGTFVVTNDAFFDPRRSTGQDGTRLDPLR